MNDDQLGAAVGRVMRELYLEQPAASAHLSALHLGVPHGLWVGRSRAALGAISAALVTAALTGTIVAIVDRERHQTNSAHPAQTAASVPPLSASRAVGPVPPMIVGDRLTRPYSLNAGQLQLKPAPASANPRITDSAARALGLQHRWIDTGSRSSVFLAILTSYARATDVDEATGHLRPNIDKRLVWVLFQQDVPQYGRGGAPVNGAKPAPLTEYLSVRFNALDADTGKNIEGDYLTNLTDHPVITTAPR
jgi:hypothetical protein